MKHPHIKLLSLLLCAVMVFGLIPPVPVSAAEYEGNPDPNYVMSEDGWDYYKVAEETEEVEIPVVEETNNPGTVNAVTKDEYSEDSYYFETFADLKEILAMSFEEDSYPWAQYKGTEPLTITEDITLPATMNLYVWDVPLTIAEGVTVTLQRSCWLGTTNLTVDGTLNAYDAGVHATNKLTVNGAVNAGYISVYHDTKVVGADKISYATYHDYMEVIAYSIYSEEDFYKYLEMLAPLGAEHLRSVLEVDTSAMGKELVLTKSFTVPEQMTIRFYGANGVTIDSGCTVTLKGSISAQVDLVIKGTVDVAKNGYAYINCRSGSLALSGGKITGRGQLGIDVGEDGDPKTAVEGMDMSKYELVHAYDNFYYVRNVEGLTKLANPAPAKWGIRYDGKWNAFTGKYDLTEVKIPCSFAVSGVKDSEYIQITVYLEKDGDDEKVAEYQYSLVDEEDVASIDIFQNGSRPSGTYYVTTKAIGDYATTIHSDVVTSEKFVYTNPGKALDKVTNVKAENGVITWDEHPDKTYADGYLVCIFFSKTADGELEQTWFGRSVEKNSMKLPQYIVDQLGDGYYAAAVSVYSKDATKFLSSEAVKSNKFQAAPPETLRYAGKDRFETSFLVADALLGYYGNEQFGSVVIASGANFADALAGSYLASWYGAPILLSYKDKQNNQVKEYIKEKLVEGGRIYILGGESAVPKSMEKGLESYKIIRLAGDNRFGTNLEILKEVGIFEHQDILVSTGSNFADSLSASAVGMPILLVHKKLTDEQKDYLTKNADPKNNNIVILGGESAVNATVEAEFKALGFNVKRLAGANRFETSVMVAKTYFGNPKNAVLAYAGNYPDGLCGGTLAMYMGAPLILTMDKFASVAADYVKTAGVERTVTLGGTGLVSDGAVSTILGK